MLLHVMSMAIGCQAKANGAKPTVLNTLDRIWFMRFSLYCRVWKDLHNGGAPGGQGGELPHPEPAVPDCGGPPPAHHLQHLCQPPRGDLSQLVWQ